MNLFEHALEQASSSLEVTNEAMTMKQKQKVASMRRSGWDITKKEDDKVVMTKGDKEVFVYSSGKTFFITESGSQEDITILTDSFLQEDDLLVEGKVDDIVDKLKRVIENPTIVTLRRGNEVFVVSKGKSNEYTKMINGQVNESGKLSNRRTADELIVRLDQSGYREVDFKSVVPRTLSSVSKTILSQAPLIALMTLVYVYIPGASLVVNLILRGAWGLVSSAIMSVLPIDSLTAFQADIDRILSGRSMTSGVVTDIDAITGASAEAID